MNTADDIKARALRLLADGLATYAEIAALSGKPRQTIRLWASVASIDPIAARRELLARMWLSPAD